MADNASSGLSPASARSFVNGLSAAQQAMLAAAFVATVTAVFFVSRLGGNGPMAMLFTDLEPTSASATIDELNAREVPYDLVDGGRAIRVPADQVLDLRVALAGAGTVGAAEGWSVLDDQGLTSSAFDQQVGYQRALEGELARTITVIEGVGAANVHLVMPEDDLFSGDDVRATASVLLQTGGSALTSSQIQAIVNLVSNSVEGLVPDAVSITDEMGRPLAGDGETGVMGDAGQQARSGIERDLERQVETMLAAVVGPGNAVVTVSADVDLSSSMVTVESYDTPEDGETAPMLVQSSRVERYRGDGASLDTGVLGPEDDLIVDDEGNGDALGDEAETVTNADGVIYDLDENDTQFAIGRTVTTSEEAPGTVTALSVAVVMNESAIDAARLPEIESVVTAAVGLDANRGDVLAVSLLPFDETIQASLEAAMTPATFTDPSTSGLIPMLRLGLAGAIAVITTVLLAVFGFRSRKPRVIAEVAPAELEASAASAATAAAVSAAPTLRLGAAPGDDDELVDLIESQPDDVAGMLRSWMADDEVNA